MALHVPGEPLPQDLGSAGHELVDKGGRSRTLNIDVPITYYYYFQYLRRSDGFWGKLGNLFPLSSTLVSNDSPIATLKNMYILFKYNGLCRIAEIDSICCRAGMNIAIYFRCG